MKIAQLTRLELFSAVLALALLAQAGCRRETASGSSPSTDPRGRAAPKKEASGTLSLDPCALALAPHSGTESVDGEIIRLQQEVPKSRHPEVSLERLGWLFIKKARLSFDPGFFSLAEQCGLCLETKTPGAPEALLLRGHALQNMHRFKEAEPLARALVARRKAPFDYGLLGDVLMEIGQLDEAIIAYQKMMDLKPDLHAYARVAHIRWLKGDLAGAMEAMQLAVDAASPQDAESAAWVRSRLANYQFQAGRNEQARETCGSALRLQKDYPPALLTQGRMLLAEGQSEGSVTILRRAMELNPLPEYQWALAEALHAAGRTNDSLAVAAELHKSGAANDARTYALFLATRRERTDVALRLAEVEMENRADNFSQDALSWALAAAGRWNEARTRSQLALAPGTADARLFLHAGIIAANSGQAGEARIWLDKARAMQQTLFPSEREELQRSLATLDTAAAAPQPPVGKK